MKRGIEILLKLTAGAILMSSPLRAQQQVPNMHHPLQLPAPQGAPERSVIQPRQEIQLHIVSKEQFCGRLRGMFQNFGIQNGYNKTETTLLSTNATAAIVKEFRSGRATDYINAAALMQTARVPNRTPPGGYLPLAGFIGGALGIQSQNMALALSAGELRFLPHAQKGMDVIVIAGNAASLTPERARKIVEVAQGLKVRIHAIWAGQPELTPSEIEEARLLASVVALTGGRFANLSGTSEPCGELF